MSVKYAILDIWHAVTEYYINRCVYIILWDEYNNMIRHRHKRSNHEQILAGGHSVSDQQEKNRRSHLVCRISIARSVYKKPV